MRRSSTNTRRTAQVERGELAALVSLMALGAAPLIVALATGSEIDAMVGLAWALFLIAGAGLVAAVRSSRTPRSRSGNQPDATRTPRP